MSANQPCPMKRWRSAPSCCSTPSWAICRSPERSAVAALRQMSAAHAHVIRDEARQSIPATAVVPGDILLIEAGDTVPADARLMESTALQTAEAALTGESLPVAKDTLPIPAEVGLGDRHNMLFSGTVATYGRGRAVVTATGMQTQMGRIAGMLQAAPTETTPLQQELARVGKLLGLIVVVIAVVMIATIFSSKTSTVSRRFSTCSSSVWHSRSRRCPKAYRRW